MRLLHRRAWLTVISLLIVVVATSPSVACRGKIAESQQELHPTAMDRPRTLFDHSMPASAPFFLYPTTVQELVNRSDAVVIATVGTIGDPMEEGLLDHESVSELVSREIPAPTLVRTYYEILVEEVLLDDRPISALDGNVYIAVSGVHTENSPQRGERMLFALLSGRGPGEYGLVDDWSLVMLDGGPIRNFDGSDPGYDGVIDEATLKSAVSAAADNHQPSLPADWPTVFDR